MFPPRIKGATGGLLLFFFRDSGNHGFISLYIAIARIYIDSIPQAVFFFAQILLKWLLNSPCRRIYKQILYDIPT